MDLNKDYITIILEDKIYSQRTPNSKFIEFDLNGVRLNSYDELPYDIKRIVDVIKDMEINPEFYFKYKNMEDGIIINSIDNVNVPYIKIPSHINGRPVKYLGYEATMNIRSIQQIHLPETIEALPQYGFKGLTKLRYINIPEKINSIPNECFANCYLLNQINLENITHIGSFAFDQCASLKEINLPKIVTLDNHVFNNCVKISKVNLTGPITLISNNVFNNCLKLKELILSDDIKIIQNNAFSNCGLESFTAPKNLIRIGNLCFFNNKLKDVHLNEKLETIGKKAFDENKSENVYIYPNTKYESDTFDTKHMTLMDKDVEQER